MNEYMKMLGHKAKDKVTGFAGTVTSMSFDLYGCVQAVVCPDAGKDGKIGDSHWFDAKRLVITSKTPAMPMPDFSLAGAEAGPAEKPAAKMPTRA